MNQASPSFFAFEPAPAARAYRELDAAGVIDVLAGLPEIRARLGGAQRAWRVRDVADGNLNAVYLVDGPAGGVCVKQALPYVRVAKDTWPRGGLFGAPRAVRRPSRPGDSSLRSRSAVDRDGKLEPHVILRKGLIEGRRTLVSPPTSPIMSHKRASTLPTSPRRLKRARRILRCSRAISRCSGSRSTSSSSIPIR